MTENLSSIRSCRPGGLLDDAQPEEAFSAQVQQVRARRAAGAVLVVGALIYFLAEFIAAAAWTDPPYSYTYHFISDLGVHGPSVLFGQYMYSPLAWVMNTGFFLFGLTLFTGIALLGRSLGRRRWLVLVTGAMLAVGGVLLALFPGSGEAMNDGTGDYHSLGALAGFIGGNLLAILLGRRHRELQVSSTLGKVLVAAGITGLVSMVGYFADIVSGANVLVGLVERGAVYPFLIGLICLGASIWSRRTSTRQSEL
ncbi:DUF998 domain-containing protein [Kribbella italica]|uniref:Putative membrane protein n=1 Tax=Kribbella italica TaxID=1540520 RepID=A0A7W9J6R9_9ACTN|nr:DUF998 domain-containing protein [Kribbella italica]MBB5836661.1 putative membrane protein [Kribbella italica]